jgi:Xaa-Pro aminopeptidase
MIVMSKQLLFSKILMGIICLLLSSKAKTQEYPFLESLRNEATIRDQWLDMRLQRILPDLMRREKIDCWIIIAREYNEDPVIPTLLPATWFAARRRTILVIHDPGEGNPLDCRAIARYNVGSAFKSSWDPEQEPDQWKALMDAIEALNPQSIGINLSEDFALADGLSASEYQTFYKYLPGKYANKVKSAESLAIGWLETRLPEERVAYEQLCRIAHNIISEGFSEKVIQPGITTTEDVVWWFRERIRSLGLTTWFHPTVDIQRADPEQFDHLRAFSKRPDTQVIQYGDLLHCDVGIVYYGLHTDTQQHAYVLKPGERDAPEYLKKALLVGNKAQNALTNAFKTGRTGNEILKLALDSCKKAGIKSSIYTHPVGVHGHAAGTTIGLWDQQGGVPIKGDYPLYAHTAHAIELNVTVNIPEWGKDIRIMLEEDAFFDDDQVIYMDGRQKAFHLIPRPSAINGQ